jgi:hypothetical protein
VVRGHRGPSPGAGRAHPGRLGLATGPARRSRRPCWDAAPVGARRLPCLPPGRRSRRVGTRSCHDQPSESPSIALPGGRSRSWTRGSPAPVTIA